MNARQKLPPLRTGCTGGPKVDKAAAMIWNIAEGHRETWQGQPDKKWFLGLLEEVFELALALLGRHKHPWTTGDVIEHELVQIGSITLNWLRRRYKETGNEKGFELDWDPYRQFFGPKWVNKGTKKRG